MSKKKQDFLGLTQKTPRSLGFIYEIYSPINCLSIHQYHKISSTTPKDNKSLPLLPSFSSPTITHMLLLDVIESRWPNESYCFAILIICIFAVSSQPQRYHNDITSLLVIFGDIVQTQDCKYNTSL